MAWIPPQTGVTWLHATVPGGLQYKPAALSPLIETWWWDSGSLMLGTCIGWGCSWTFFGKRFSKIWPDHPSDDLSTHLTDGWSDGWQIAFYVTQSYIWLVCFVEFYDIEILCILTTTLCASQFLVWNLNSSLTKPGLEPIEWWAPSEQELMLILAPLHLAECWAYGRVTENVC